MEANTENPPLSLSITMSITFHNISTECLGETDPLKITSPLLFQNPGHPYQPENILLTNRTTVYFFCFHVITLLK